MIVGVGGYSENHITGVYVFPDYQNRGYGSQTMDCLEKMIMEKKLNEIG